MNQKVEVLVDVKEKLHDEGYLMGWSIESENVEGVTSIYTVAIVRFMDGTVETVSLHKLRFL